MKVGETMQSDLLLKPGVLLSALPLQGGSAILLLLLTPFALVIPLPWLFASHQVCHTETTYTRLSSPFPTVVPSLAVTPISHRHSWC